MATVQELARILADSLTTQDRNGKTITVTKDGAPEWVTDVVHAAHGNLLPDDWTYETVDEVAQAIARGEDGSEMESEFYTGALLSWLAEYSNAVDYCDQAVEEYGPFDSITAQIQAGQLLAKQEIYSAVYAALEELAEQEDEEEEHVHAWGPVETSRFAGTPHRRCECGAVSLDLDDEESDDEE